MRKGEPKERNKISRLGPFSMNPLFRNDIVLGTVNLIKHSSAKPRNEKRVSYVRSFTMQDCLFIGWLPYSYHEYTSIHTSFIHTRIQDPYSSLSFISFFFFFFFGRSVYMYIEDRVPGEASSSRTNSILWLSESV